MRRQRVEEGPVERVAAVTSRLGRTLFEPKPVQRFGLFLDSLQTTLEEPTILLFHVEGRLFESIALRLDVDPRLADLIFGHSSRLDRFLHAAIDRLVVDGWARGIHRRIRWLCFEGNGR